MFDIDVYKNGVRAIPRRDIERENAVCKPGEVTVRQMTAEERERMEKIGPCQTYDGRKSKTFIPGWQPK